MMDSDKFGTLVHLRDLTSKLTKSDDFGSLLQEFTKIIGNEMMHKIVYKGLYEYYPLLQSKQIYNLMTITLQHCKQINEDKDNETKNNNENSINNLNISEISNKSEFDIKSKLINVVILHCPQKHWRYCSKIEISIYFQTTPQKVEMTLSNAITSATITHKHSVIDPH